MHFQSVLGTFATAFLGLAQSISASCTAQQRLAAAEAIPHAYNLVAPGASAAAFAQIPFAADCLTQIHANGLPAIPVAVTGNTTVAFADVSRQAFTKVTGQYTDFPNNATTEIFTHVTLGALHSIPAGVVFTGYVYLDFDSNCDIEKVDAFATVPTEVLGIMLDGLNLTSDAASLGL